MRKVWKYLFLCVLTVSLYSCKNKIPSTVIQPGALENILYDYHLAQAMGEEFEGDERYKRELLVQYVFRKHGVTQAEFDSSMVWYTRHMERLNEVYMSLNWRFKETRIEAFAQNYEVAKQGFPSGDSINIWRERPLYFLTASDLTNRMTFDLIADTTFHVLDRLVWSLHTLALPQDSIGVFAGLTAYYSNDSTSSVTQLVSANGAHELELQLDTLPLKSVRGFLYLNDTIAGDTVPSVVINHITLMRYHAAPQVLDSLKQKEEPRDTVKVEQKEVTKVDTVQTIQTVQPTDTATSIGKRLSPAELRRRKAK